MAWSKARINKMLTARRANAILKAAKRAKRAFPPVPEKIEGKPVDGLYAGEQPSVDVNRIEDRAFRRGLFTGLQMVVDLLIRELR